MEKTDPPIRTAAFFRRHATEVAHDLIGKKFVFHAFTGIITETEAYSGQEDEASHAYKGRTLRNHVMFGPPGHLYVYFIYGMHYCFNIVTQEADDPGAVLIRGLLLPHIYLNGPGKICKHLGISSKENGLNLLTHPDVYIAEGPLCPVIKTTPRIGIKKATEKPWRYINPEFEKANKTKAPF